MMDEILDYEPDEQQTSTNTKWSECSGNDVSTPSPESMNVESTRAIPIQHEGSEIYYSKCLETVRKSASLNTIKLLPSFGEQRNYFTYAQANAFLKNFLRLMYFNRRGVMGFFNEEKFFIKVDNDNPTTTTVSLFFTWNTFGMVYRLRKIDENNAILATFSKLLPYVIANENFEYPPDMDVMPNGGYKNADIFDCLVYLIREVLLGRAITKVLQNPDQKWMKTEIFDDQTSRHHSVKTIVISTPNFKASCPVIPERRYNSNMKLKHVLKSSVMDMLDKM